MKKLSILLLLVLIGFVSYGQSVDAAKQVEDMARRKFRWLLDKNVDSLGDVLDDRLMYIHSNGMTQSKSDVINDLKSGKLTYQTLEVRDLQVRVYDKMAILVGKGKFAGMNGGNAFAVDLLFTEVFVLTNKTWRLASRHASKLP